MLKDVPRPAHNVAAWRGKTAALVLLAALVPRTPRALTGALCATAVAARQALVLILLMRVLLTAVGMQALLLLAPWPLKQRGEVLHAEAATAGQRWLHENANASHRCAWRTLLQPACITAGG